jgi:hypothetical protein
MHAQSLFHFNVSFQVFSDEELLHTANELIRLDVAHEVNDASDFNAKTLLEDSKHLFRLIDDESPSYLKKRCTLASFLSPRHSPAVAIAGFGVFSDLQAKYFTGSIRTWRHVYAILGVLGTTDAHEEPLGQIHFANIVLFENQFGPPSVNVTVTGGQDKVLKIVSLRHKAPVLGIQSFNGRPGEMSEIEIFLEFSSEEIQNEWLLMLCQIGVVPGLESPSQDSGFSFCQTFASGAAQFMRYTCLLSLPCR